MDVDQSDSGSILKAMLTLSNSNCHQVSLSPSVPSTSQVDKDVFSATNVILNDEAHNDATNNEKNNSIKFQVNRSKIMAVASGEQDLELQDLGLDVYNQDEFEQGILDQVDDAFAAEEEIRLNKVLEKEMKAIQDDVSSCKQEVANCEKVIKELTQDASKNKELKRRLNAVMMQKENKDRQLKRLEGRQKALIQKTQRSLQALTAKQNTDSHNKGPSVHQALGLGNRETDAERMVRLGEMTPFGTVISSQNGDHAQASSSNITEFEMYLLNQQAQSRTSSKSKKKIKRTSSDLSRVPKSSSNSAREDEPIVKKIKKSKSTPEISDANIISPFGKKNDANNSATGNYFDKMDKKVYRPYEKDFSNYKTSKRQIYPKLKHNFSGESRPDFDAEDEYDSDDYNRDKNYEPSSSELLDDEGDEQEYSKIFTGHKQSKNVTEYDLGGIKEKYTGKKKKSSSSSSAGAVRGRDDGNIHHYNDRIKQWQKARLKKKHEKIMNEEVDSDDCSDIEFDGGFKVPAKIWNKLYRYQKTGVKWLWELHLQQCGGIVGDEMGLGKTIQMITFLVGLHYSDLRDRGTNSKYKGLGPTIIVCPATVMHQWVKEFHTWWPPFRVAVLHNTGSYASQSTEKDLVHNIIKQRGILITSYSSVVIHQELLLNYDWQYIVLDEGHKIRNPDAQATLACKQFRTCHRLILSGSPMQNNLKELWSLFDFVFPGKLGTLPDFMAHFSVPITQGGYSNASQVQVQTAYKCACVLRDTINPYLIRRLKADVKTSLNLPQKNEQVLFCRLTDHQREVYQEYLDSKECSQILRGNYMVFPGLITLRKICNHPDLSTGGPRDFTQDALDMTAEELEYGYFRRSGKLIVIESLLKMWKKQKHKVLIFTQGQQMLNVLEKFVQKQGYNYLRMDGTTGISARQPLIMKFNQSPEIFTFLLTTRVGGLGVNLTGANRVVIFDPDWNPSTDAQARERAWRIGQNKSVTIYRLITTGTIEEKIYHRQIFKQFLTNRVLKDPKQRRFFKSNDLFELFTLGTDDMDVGTETSAIFAGTGSDIKVNLNSKDDEKKDNRDNRNKDKKCNKNRFDLLREKKKSKIKDETEEDPDIDISGNNEGEVDFNKDKLERMRELAKRLSLQITSKGNRSASDVKLSLKNKKDVDTGSSDNCDPNDTQSQISDYKNDDDSAKLVQKFNQDIEILKEKEIRAKKKHEKRKRKEEEEKRKKRKDEKRSKRKNKNRDAVFEGEKIAQLDHSKAYVKPSSDDEHPKSSNEDYVLQRLFKKSGGLHSAVQHDTIMMSSNPDYALVEGEANRVAKEASRALKRSRQLCFGAQMGMPTWTGANGTSKPRFGQKKNAKLMDLPKEKEKSSKAKQDVPVVDTLFAPDPVVHHFDGSLAGIVKTGGNNPTSSVSTSEVMTSENLIQRMKTRNYLTTEVLGPDDDDELDNDPNNPWVGSLETNPKYLELITDIRNHIAFGCTIDGQATTDELLEHFHSNLPPKDSAKFKAMLKQICTFERVDGVGIWRLKVDFR